MRWTWFSFGWIFFAVGIVGIALPVLPTTPFMLLAAFCFSKSSPRWHQWLITRPHIGPLILDWNQRRAISRRSKILATLTMIPLFSLTLIFTAAPIIAKIIIVIIGATVLTFIWTRPE